MIIKTNLDEIEIFGKKIIAKREDQQINKSFKIRGINNFIDKNWNNDYKDIVVATSGNHGIQSAYAAKEKGINIKVYVPTRTPKLKIDKMKKFGAEVIVVGDILDETIRIANESTGGDSIFIPPFDNLDIIDGHMSVWSEDAEYYSNGEFDVFVPVGGGAIAAATSKYFSTFDNVRVITVETDKTNSLQNSIKHGSITSIEIDKTIAEGIAVNKPGENTFPIIKEHSYDNISISEDKLQKVMDELESKGIILEGAGAVSLAGALEYNSGKRTQVALFSGGNK